MHKHVYMEARDDLGLDPSRVYIWIQEIHVLITDVLMSVQCHQ